VNRVSRKITIPINRKTSEVFDEILHIPKKMMPDAKKDDDGWWSFTGPYGPAKLKFNENSQLGILDHQYVDNEAIWDIPMRVVSSGDFSEVVITLLKPDHFSEELFNERTNEIQSMMEKMKQIIEQN